MRGACIGRGLLFKGGVWLLTLADGEPCLPKAKGSVSGCGGGVDAAFGASAPCLCGRFLLKAFEPPEVGGGGGGDVPHAPGGTVVGRGCISA